MTLNWSADAAIGSRGTLRTSAAGAVIVWVCICHLLEAGWPGVLRLFVPEHSGRYPRGIYLRGFTEAIERMFRPQAAAGCVDGASNALRQIVLQIGLQKHL